MNAPVLHPVPVKSATVIPGGNAGHGKQVPPKEQDSRVVEFTTFYARVKNLEPGGEGAVRIERLMRSIWRNM